ncbi:MAG: hypothetical protein M0Q91_05560 [Methanoregula sp.]|jgi:hypothetical protein|nr:hypothetical protein [Methanoregula sp.]
MGRLSAEEQKEYEEEVEYHRDSQIIKIPDRHHPSALEKISNAVKGTAKKINEFDNGPTGKRIRSFAERVNASEGLGGGSGFGAPGIMQNSSMNPKKKIYKNEGHRAPRTIRDILNDDRGL